MAERRPIGMTLDGRTWYRGRSSVALVAASESAERGAPRPTRIVVDPGAGLPGLEAAACETELAMRRGDAVIHQATFFQADGNARWRGHTDFLVRVDTPSSLGAWGYEPADAKLARAAKVGAILQLCAYAKMVARLQGRPPELIRLILGGPGHPEERLRLADYDAYYRWTKATFVAALAAEEPAHPVFGLAQPGQPAVTGAPTAHAFWARDPATEKKAFEDTVDLIVEARRRDPRLHIFHYNHYEPTALKRLMSRHGTREAEVDDLLRNGVFVDLYRVFRQGVRAGVESYSIKKLEALYGFTRAAEPRDAGAARAEMDAWLELGASAPLPDEIREKVRVYNLDDCLSAWKLRDWLEARRAELAAQAGRDVPRPSAQRRPRARRASREGRRGWRPSLPGCAPRAIRARPSSGTSRRHASFATDDSPERVAVFYRARLKALAPNPEALVEMRAADKTTLILKRDHDVDGADRRRRRGHA